MFFFLTHNIKILGLNTKINLKCCTKALKLFLKKSVIFVTVGCNLQKRKAWYYL